MPIQLKRNANTTTIYIYFPLSSSSPVSALLSCGACVFLLSSEIITNITNNIDHLNTMSANQIKIFGKWELDSIVVEDVALQVIYLSMDLVDPLLISLLIHFVSIPCIHSLPSIPLRHLFGQGLVFVCFVCCMCMYVDFVYVYKEKKKWAGNQRQCFSYLSQGCNIYINQGAILFHS